LVLFIIEMRGSSGQTAAPDLARSLQKPCENAPTGRPS
jgi:hypothetical protein